MRLGLSELTYLLCWALRTRLPGQRRPLIAVLILNNECNLSCRHCPVRELPAQSASFEQVCRDLETLYRLGVRFLILSGGEPFLWRDGDHDLERVVRQARRQGYFSTVVCTNGTLPLESTADYLLVSVDGGEEDHDRIRGQSHERIIEHIDRSAHTGIYVNLSINALNHQPRQVDRAVESLRRHAAIRGILFSLFVPYLGTTLPDLDPALRQGVVEQLVRIKRAHPRYVVNTRAALGHLLRDDWQRPLWADVTIFDGELSPCCCRRELVSPEICARCSLAPCVESYVIQRLSLGAALEYLPHL
jgi:MoaA/NifB/PqqE/SkfB family radical SAM enzyme